MRSFRLKTRGRIRDETFSVAIRPESDKARPLPPATAPEKYPAVFRFAVDGTFAPASSPIAFNDDLQSFCFWRPDPEMRLAFADQFRSDRDIGVWICASTPTPSLRGGGAVVPGFLFSCSASRNYKVAERCSFTMPGIIERYTKWLHTQWPAGTVEKLPVSGDGGRDRSARACGSSAI